jgi:hypothetical protein
MTPDEQRADTGVAPDFKAVAKIAQRIRLNDVRLRWSQLGRFTVHSEPDHDWSRKAFLFFDSHAVLPEDEQAEVDEFLVQAVFQLRYFVGLDSALSDSAPEPDEENPPDIAIEAVFDLIYGINDWANTDPADFDHFALANGTHNAWPYWREFAQNTSLRLGLRPYVVGPFKLPSRDDPREQQASPDKSEDD